MSVRIITDSTSDITQAEARALDIQVVPLKVIIDDVTYRDGIDIDNTEFFQRLAKTKSVPTTTQPSPQDFLDAYLANDADELVVLTVAGTLSGTYQSAVIAAAEAEHKKIYLIDSEIGTLGLNILVRRAIQLRDRGLDGAAIARMVEREKKDLVLLATVDTLENLKRSGRLSKAAAFAGGLLGIKPILTIEEGVIKMLGKERGREKAFAFLRDTAVGMGLPDLTRPCALGYTADPGNMNALREVLGPRFCPEETVIDHIGSAIGTHVGPGVAAYVYFKK